MKTVLLSLLGILLTSNCFAFSFGFKGRLYTMGDVNTVFKIRLDSLYCGFNDNQMISIEKKKGIVVHLHDRDLKCKDYVQEAQKKGGFIEMRLVQAGGEFTSVVSVLERYRDPRGFPYYQMKAIYDVYQTLEVEIVIKGQVYQETIYNYTQLNKRGILVGRESYL